MLMVRSPASALCFCVLTALLAGCGSKPPPSVPSAPGAGGQAATPSPSTHGIYKIGQPYQIDGTWYYPAEQWDYDERGIASWYGEDFHGKYTANGEVYDLNALTAAHRTLPMPCIVEVTNLDNGRSINLRVNDRGPFARGRVIDVSRRAAQLLGFESAGTAKVRVRIMVPESIEVASLAGRNGGDADAPHIVMHAAPVAPIATEPLAPTPGVRVVAAPATPHPISAPPPPVRQAAPVPVVDDPPPLPERVAIVPVGSTQIYVQAGAFARSDNALRLKAKLDGLGPVVVTGARINGNDIYRVRVGPLTSVDEADRLLSRIVSRGAPDARIVVD